MKRCRNILFGLLLMVILIGNVAGENYVNFKGGFWISVPETWEKINYRIVDRYLMMIDTSRELLNYEAVFAPVESQPFIEDDYLVITFDSIGEVSASDMKSMLDELAELYTSRAQAGGWNETMDSKAQIDYQQYSISVKSHMATENMKRRRWVYSRYTGTGVVTLDFYSLDSTFQDKLPVFEEIVGSLSFEGLREAAQKEIKFSDVGSGDIAEDGESSGWSDADSGAGNTIMTVKNIVIVVVVAVILFGLVWNFMIAPARRKKRK